MLMLLRGLPCHSVGQLLVVSRGGPALRWSETTPGSGAIPSLNHTYVSLACRGVRLFSSNHDVWLKDIGSINRRGNSRNSATRTERRQGPGRASGSHPRPSAAYRTRGSADERTWGEKRLQQPRWHAGEGSLAAVSAGRHVAAVAGRLRNRARQPEAFPRAVDAEGEFPGGLWKGQ
jgi:hypothetical protein